jgi:phospholipid/cholesterol/gamma-HCH transport system permease protein
MRGDAVSAAAPEPAWKLEPAAGGPTLVLSGEWTMQRAVPDAGEIGLQIGANPAGGGEHPAGVPGAASAELHVDVAAVTRWDSSLPAFLLGVVEHGAGQGWTLQTGSLPPRLRAVVDLARAVPPAHAGHRRPAGRLVRRLGVWALGRLEELRAALSLVGEFVVACGQLLRGKARFYPADAWLVLQACGADALPIVGIVNLLVGAILAFVGAVQLVQFGASEYVADGVAIAAVREMSAVMTAIVLAGRTGAAFAAQIANMQGNEEIDALAVMGVPPSEFLVLPRVLALALMAPLLYLYGCLLSIVGGLLVAIGMLDLSLASYLDRTLDALNGTNFILGASKSLSFGILVSLAGCHYGLRAGRNSAAVGEATTAAVVAGIVGVIAIDALFAVCANALGV